MTVSFQDNGIWHRRLSLKARSKLIEGCDNRRTFSYVCGGLGPMRLWVCPAAFFLDSSLIVTFGNVPDLSTCENLFL